MIKYHYIVIPITGDSSYDGDYELINVSVDRQWALLRQLVVLKK